MAWHLKHQIAWGFVHPVKQYEMAAGLDVLEAVAPARIDIDGTDRLRLPGVLRAVLALLPGRVDTANEIQARIRLTGEVDRLFTVADAEIFVGAHGRSLARLTRAF